MERAVPGEPLETGRIHQLARLVLAALLLTFICARVLVFLIMARRLPDLFLHLGGTHVHHLNYGIFILAAVGAYLLFDRPRGRALSVAAVLYGVGVGLTFDEFGMWLHLGGSYWQRASWDAIVVVAALFALVAFSTSLKRLRPHHWWMGALLAVAVLLFFAMLAESFSYAGKKLAPKLRQIEAEAPP